VSSARFDSGAIRARESGGVTPRFAVAIVAVVAAIAGGYWAGSKGLGLDAHAPDLHPAVPAEAATGERQVLYYRNPMGLPDTSPEPKKDSMGMDYIPVYADEASDDPGTVAVSAARMQTLGVRTAQVRRETLDSTLSASGRVEIDERAQVVVAPRFEGWVERLHVSAVGDVVRRGQPLLTAWSPVLQSAGEELRIAERLQRESAGDTVSLEAATRLAEAARARLRNLEVGGQTGARQTLHAPVDGVVLERTVLQGARFMPGDNLYRIADLSVVWVIADVFERDLARVRPGDRAQVSLQAFPGKVFEGRVGYVYPTLDGATRSTPVRIELDNREGLLRPGMFARVDLAVDADQTRLVVPASAVIDDGERQVVLVALEEGRFRPQNVVLGVRGREFIEVKEGLAVGDRVVVSANFLIDSESQLRAALSNLGDSDEPAPPRRFETLGQFEVLHEDGAVSLSHDEIPALGWPEMTMDFGLDSPALVEGMAPGTPIRFEFEERGPGEYVVTRVERLSGSTVTQGQAAPGAVTPGVR
jgi:membrane fusion protein, copper/silver efflux system